MAILYFRLLFNITNGDFLKFLECLPFVIFIMIVVWGGLLNKVGVDIDFSTPDFDFERLIQIWVW
ncbi:hypothetical protein [Pseudomonas sp. zfem002]|uniref:hypothetical protein n=1 Tax=Pseudomonas sp. zfem002 TaxID=3078197 RepID=UPI002927638A|nr:hypothetical protein [Pseudomonas sp. zfem002]MDU9389249.1 hypothetical protein [Pseudomonas sp. zfem002]